MHFSINFHARAFIQTHISRIAIINNNNKHIWTYKQAARRVKQNELTRFFVSRKIKTNNNNNNNSKQAQATYDIQKKNVSFLTMVFK